MNWVTIWQDASVKLHMSETSRETKVVGTVAPVGFLFHGCETLMERKFLEHSLLSSKSSRGAKVPWNESFFRSLGANAPRNESSLCGLLALGNESVKERKVQIRYQ